ncbi:hypothetical protein BPAE_0034g00260 [Botrytis paeoniae]|uniref:Uncharacterized protein n=1 Tax=Botrytis paeoniae TaxID=278948 RepID=A0A4Z1FT83_9HELO|nr:hypothetical protein BPAE_0034g00260 [Botrytis paeoniae]
MSVRLGLSNWNGNDSHCEERSEDEDCEMHDDRNFVEDESEVCRTDYLNVEEAPFMRFVAQL